MNRLKELRREEDWTLREVAEKIGIPKATVHRHETGLSELDALAIDRYTRLYRVKPLELWLSPEQIQQLEENSACLTNGSKG